MNRFFLLAALLLGAVTTRAEVTVRSIRYDGRLSDQEARFSAELDLEMRGKQPQSLPLFEGELALLTTKLPDGMSLTREANRFGLTLSKEGRHKLKLEFIAKISRTEPWNHVSFSGPTAVIGEVVVQTAGEGMELQLLKGTVAEVTAQAGATRLRGFLGHERAVAMRWQSKAAEVARKALLTCDTVVGVQITPTVVKYATQLKYEIVQGQLSRLLVSLPATQALTKLQGDGVRDWAVKPDGTNQIITIDLVRPVERQYALSLYSEQTVESATASVPLAPPQPLEVEREAGGLTVTAEDVLVETETVSGLRQVNAAAGALAAYQFYARPFALGLKLRRIEPVISVADRLSVRLEEARLVAAHLLNLTIEKAGIYALELQPQAGFVVADVRGEGVEDWKSQAGKLQVNFNRRVLGAYRLEVQLEQARRSEAGTNAQDLVIGPLRVPLAAKETAVIGAGAAAGQQLKTAADGLRGLREMPVNRLPDHSGEVLAYQAEQNSWQLRLSAERLAARVTADIFNLITIGDGIVGGSATLRYAMLNQGVQEFQVKLPAHWRNVEFTGPNIRRKEQHGDTWTIALQEKAWGGYTLVVTYDFQFPPQGGTLPVGGAHAVGVERETGSIAVTSAANLQITEGPQTSRGTAPGAERPGNLRRVDEAELAANDRALISRPVLLAYLYTGESYELAAQVVRYQELPILEAVADRTQLTTVLTESGELLTQASFMVKNNDKQFLSFSLPGQADFWSCFVRGEPAKPERTGQKLLVPLPRGLNRDEAFAVDIVYAQRVGSLKNAWTDLALAAPLTDVQTTYAEWELFIPPSHRLARFAGNMIVAQGTTHGLRDAWQDVIRFYDELVASHTGTLVALALLFGLLLLIIAAVRRGWRWVGSALAILVVFVVLSAMLLPALSKSRERARRASSMSSLKQIGLGIAQYYDDNNNTMPASFEQIRKYIGDDRVFLNPSTGGRFTYVGPHATWQGSQLQPLAYGETGDGGANVLFTDGHVEYTRDFGSLLARVQQPRPTTTPSPVAPGAAAGPQLRLLQKLKQIRLPDLNFREASLADLARFLQDESRRLDPEGRGVPIVLGAGLSPQQTGSGVPTGARPITLCLRDVPVEEALKYVTSLGGIKYRIERDRVLLLPVDAAEGQMLMRFYPVTPGVFAQGTDPRQFLTVIGVPFPAGASATYDPSQRRLSVRNTTENLELLERALAELNVMPQQVGIEAKFTNATQADLPQPGFGWGAGSGRAYAAGLRPLRIEIPKTGTRFVFTKVMNVRGDTLSFSALALDDKWYRALRGLAQALAFGIGLGLLGWQAWRRQWKSLPTAVGVALALVGLGGFLLSYRLLDEVLILVGPAIGSVILWKILRAVWRSVPPTNGPAKPPAVPPIVPPVPIPGAPEPRPGDRTSRSDPPAGLVSGLILAVLLGATAQAADKPAAAVPKPAVATSEPVLPAVEPARIVSAQYIGSVRDSAGLSAGMIQTAQFEAILDLNATSTNQSVRLFDDEVAIQEFSGPPAKSSGSWFGRKTATGEARLVRTPGAVSVLLPEKGPATVRVKFLVKLGGDVAKRRLEFNIPPALTTRLAVSIDEPEAVVELPTAVALKTLAEGQKTRVEAVMGAAERVELSWTARTKRAAEIAATVFAQNAALVTLGGGVLNVRSVLDYNVTQGELRQVRLQLPAGQRLMRVEGENIRTWKLEDQGRTLAVELVKGVSPSYRLSVETERPLEAGAKAEPVEIPHALGVKRETGLVALRTSDELTATVEVSAELQKVDLEEFTRASASKGMPTGMTSVYRFLKTNFGLTVRVAPVQPQIEAVVRNQARLSSEQLAITASVEYTIKRTGVFVLSLRLPAGYRVERVSGANIAQYVEKDGPKDAAGKAARLLEVTLKQRTMGSYSLQVHLAQTLTAIPPKLEIVGVQPLETDKTTGFVSVAAEEGLQIKTESFGGLSEVPATATGLSAGSGVLAFKMLPAETAATVPGWQLAISSEKIESWVRAEVVNWVNLTETLVSGRSLVRYEIQNAPTKEFRIKAPAGLRNVEVSGANIRRQDQLGNEWRIELQNKVRGTYSLVVSWERPWDAKAGGLELSGIEVPGVERETGWVSVTAPGSLRVDQTQATDLLKADPREIPDWAGRGDQQPVLIHRYLRPGYKLALTAQRFEEAEVLQALVDDLHLTTVVSEDGQMMTEVKLAIRNNARQYLEVSLPAQATNVWSAFVAGQPVRPTVRAGKLLLPIDRSGADGAPVQVELTYVSADTFPKRRGTVRLASPALDIPLKNARWELYLPPDYVFDQFEGSMKRQLSLVTGPSATTAPAPGRPGAALGRDSTDRFYSLADYAQVEDSNRAKRDAEAASSMSAARSNIVGGKLNDAIRVLGNLKNTWNEEEGSNKEELKKLEQDIRRAQGKQIIEQQRQYSASNALVLNGSDNAKVQTAVPQVEFDQIAAEQQAEKVQKAQEIVTIKAMPLRVNLPKRGQQLVFAQTLQTEVRKPMTVQFSAVQAKGLGWPGALGLGLAGFGLLWGLVALWLRRRLHSQGQV